MHVSTPSTVAPLQQLQPPRRNGRVPFVAARHPTYSSPHPGAAEGYSRVLGLGTFAGAAATHWGSTAHSLHCRAAGALHV